MADAFNKAVVSLKRRLESSLSEVKNINEQGRLALIKPEEVDKFKGMFRALEKYYTKYETTWDEIIDLYDAEGKAMEFPTSSDSTKKANTQRYYYEANTNFEKLNRPPSAIASSNPSLQQSSFNESTNHKKLPPIKVPEFNGDILGWPKFRDIYQSLVHNDDSLSPSIKFQYLKSSLKGAAASVIAGFATEDDGNYDLAWKAVTSAFDNKRMLASAYLNQILTFKPIQGRGTIESFKLFKSKVSDSVNALKLLKITNESDFILFHLASRYLDSVSREQFEIAHKKEKFPTFNQLDTFVNERIIALQLSSEPSVSISGESKVSSKNHKKAFSDSKSNVKTSLMVNDGRSQTNKNETPTPCFICKNGSCHHLLSCPRFDDARVDQRWDMLKNWTGCRNCLSPLHSVKACKSKWHCRFCTSKHHSSLHKHSTHHSGQNSTDISTTMTGPGTHGASLNSTCVDNNVILGTIVAEVEDARGRHQKIRMVADSGSQYSFITKKFLDKLGLKSSRFPKKISGIGQTIFDGARGKTTIKIRPRHCGAPEFSTDAVVVSNITSYLPSIPLPIELRCRYNQYTLADPDYWQPRPIDFLLGADLFSEICTGSTISFERGCPKLFSSVFGHIVIGRYADGGSDNTSTVLFSQNEPDDLGGALQRFWELEEPLPAPPILSADDLKCETHFRDTHYRNDDGRYVVCLPFKEDVPQIGDSSSVALKRFKSLERKLERDPLIRSKYDEFMGEYLSLDHMEVSRTPSRCIIPHHCVTKQVQSDIKLRVVFDGSVKVPHSSLNDQLLTGEKLQKDIREILLRFRCHRYVFITDIVKMFRMILVDESDWPFQHIYWRFSSSDALTVFALKTVTYGLSCAPFLALRVIKQLGIDDGYRFPLAKKALEHDIYVDDWVTGADSIEEVCELQRQVMGLMKCGGFSMSKWATNCEEVLQAISQDNPNTPVSLNSKEDLSVKILGLQWDPVADCFFYLIRVPDLLFTKRAILSTVARLFDPLGFLTPVTLLLKSFIQELWKLGLGWDEQIPVHLQALWRNSVEELTLISKIRIPRFIQSTGEYDYQIIGFADASSKAYCATIYIKVLTSSKVSVCLLTSKSKLAPTKVISIPRLELCGALLLARLYQYISGLCNSLAGTPKQPVFYTDSTIVLGWLNTPSYGLKTFVSNRVTEITQSLPTSSWRHVRSEENPADLGSRGLLAGALVECSLWWDGPSWLRLPESEWPESLITLRQELPELKQPSTLAVVEVTNPFLSWMSRFSSYSGLIRTVAWLNRWRYNVKHVGCCCCQMMTGPLSLGEIRKATTTCILAVQLHYFFHDRDPDRQVATNLFPQLSPFLDDDRVLRVGGRLSLGNMSASRKHPVLLPNKSHFAAILVDHLHRVYLHPGPTQLQALVQTQFWIPSLRRLIHRRGFMCLTCYKSKGITLTPQMGNLPSYRLEGGRAFSHVGVDFAGPFELRESLRRKAPLSKAYLCLYVCMATKAIHLEAVTRLSTEAFLSSFQRFVSRRGLPGDVYSDNGSNFIGAARHLREAIEWLKENSGRTAISNYAISLGINWHFNPPQTPHMGGIWESGVKSVKKRLHLIAGSTPLTFEEMSTLFAQIEASLNSRPLCPLSSSPEETNYLTPGHFLVGGALQAIPEPSLLDLRENTLSRWQLVQKMSEQFWTRWRLEYLATLQSRIKWQRDVPNLQVGDLVLLNDDSPVQYWPLARVTAAHPGEDGVVRVVTLKTSSNSSVKRHVTRCGPLLPLKEPAYDSEL